MVGLAVTPTMPSSSSKRLNWPEASWERSMLSYQTLWPCVLSWNNGLVISFLLVGARCGRSLWCNVSLMVLFVTFRYYVILLTRIGMFSRHNTFTCYSHDNILWE